MISSLWCSILLRMIKKNINKKRTNKDRKVYEVQDDKAENKATGVGVKGKIDTLMLSPGMKGISSGETEGKPSPGLSSIKNGELVVVWS